MSKNKDTIETRLEDLSKESLEELSNNKGGDE